MQVSPYQPAPVYLSLGDGFADAVQPAAFPRHQIRFRNDRWAGAVGLDQLDDERWAAHFGTFEPLPDNLSAPLALRYHGHQFRSYNPDIGDGRGFLFAQLRDDQGRLLDLGTKGSGQTPYSRFGDGRLTLKGGVREVLATEMLEALGVNTSKTFSLIETGEALERHDEPSPTRGAVMVRLSHGHIRIGTFQRLATLQDQARMSRLVDYCLRHYYHEEPGDDAPARLLALVAAATAELAASYMAAGFVHGVLNSDNINISGESFDYGPWRFAPTWDGEFTAAYFDHQGLYAFGRQAQAIHWNLVQLARALTIITEAEAMIPILENWPQLFEAAFPQRLLARFGLSSRGTAADGALFAAVEELLSGSDLNPDRLFFDWRGGCCPLRADDYRDVRFDAFKQAIAPSADPAARTHGYWSDAAPVTMLIDEMEAIWQPIAAADDWSLFHDRIAAIRRMGEAMAG